VADAEALEILIGEIDHLVQVTDAEVAQAMRDIFACTHNVAEGAGAASFAAAMQERDSLQGQTVGITLCGGNVDSAVFAGVLQSQALAAPYPHEKRLDLPKTSGT
jgi:threonine dehydratase